MSKDQFRQVIDALRTNTTKRFPVVKLVKDNPELAAVVSKLTTSQFPTTYDSGGNRDTLPPNTYMFRNTSEHLAQNIADARTVLQILPDMELAAQILVSSIIAPKDMVTTEITYSVVEGLVTPDVSAALIARVKDYFEQDYKIKPLLAKMLRDILFETGSYAIAVLPENTIDDVINGKYTFTAESLSDHIDSNGSIRPLGLLGPVVLEQPTPMRVAAGLSLESFRTFVPQTKVDGRVTLEAAFSTPMDTFLSVTDNPNVLKIPQINQRLREERISKLVGIKSLESAVPKLTDRSLGGMIYKERTFNYSPLTKLKTQEQLNRKTVGNPLIIHLPSESVIPVYVPGCVEEQVGFFVLLDENGNPIAKAENADYYQQLSSRLNSNGSFPSAMLSRVKSQMQGFTPDNKEHMDYTARVYGDMVEQDLLARLKNGVYGNGVALAKNSEIYRIMFARALAKQHTQLLFIPIELMTYMAFDYTPDGMGTSLLDKMKILNSLRSMVLFADVMASLKNSIGRTEVKIKLDDTDPNPQKTIEATMHEVIRTRQQYFPLGINSPTDLTDWLQKSGFEFTYEGHPGLPDVRVDFGEKNSNYIKPDNELSEQLRKQAIMACGLSPETVDATFQAEFAVSVVTNNILLSKRVIQTQEQFTPQLSGHLRKCIVNSEKLIGDLRGILDDNFDKLHLAVSDDGKKILDKLKVDAKDKAIVEQNETEKHGLVSAILHEFIMNLEVKLPLPNSVTLDNQIAALETYSKALDASLEAWISEKFFTTDLAGNVANQVSVIKEVLKAHYIRKWMAENGVMIELSEIGLTNYDGTAAINLFKIQEEHLKSLTVSLTEFMASLDPIKAASNKVTDTLTLSQSQAAPAGAEGGAEGGSEDFGGFGGFEEGPAAEETPAGAEEGGAEKPPEAPESEQKKEEKKPTNLNEE